LAGAVAEPLTFARVTAVYRQEKDRRTLTEVEEDFYGRLEAHLAALREELAKAVAAGAGAQAKMLEDEIAKTERKREQILTERERKIALLASQRASGLAVETKGLARLEVELLERLEHLLRSMRAQARGEVPPAAVQPAAPPPAPQAVPQRLPVPERQLGDVLIIRVTQDLEPFAGLDTTYHLRKGDVLTLPSTMARVLVERGKAAPVPLPPQLPDGQGGTVK
jgi:DNA replication initiation complex subunit (GINS family)